MALNDFGTLWLAGIKEGAGIMDNALNRNLRIQELRSAEALRQMEEKQIAQHLSMQLYQHNLMVDEQADRSKAVAAMQAEMMMNPPSFTVPASGPMPSGETVPPVNIPNPNAPLPEDLYMKYIAPVNNKWQGILPGRRTTLDDLADYSRIKKERLQMQEEQAGGFQPSSGLINVPTPEGGSRQQPYVRTSKNAVTLTGTGDVSIVEQNGEKFYLDPRGVPHRIPKDLSNLRVAMAENSLAEKAPDLSIPNPDNPKLRIIDPAKWEEFAKRQSLTTATKTKIEGQQLEAAKAFSTGRQLAPLLTDENTGVRGGFRRAFEGFAPQLGFKAGTGATDTVAVAKLFQAQLTKALKTDGNIAEPERISIESAMPKPEDWFKSTAQAKSLLALQLENAGTLSRRNAEVSGKPVTVFWLKPDEIMEMSSRKEITPQVADQLLENNAWLLIKSLRDSLR